MFAYCNNNPVYYKDPTGKFGIATLCAIGAVAGGLLEYGKQVIANFHAGTRGKEMLTDVNLGEIASAAFSGAVAAVPNGGVIAEVVDAVGSNLIEHGVNALFSNDHSFDIVEVGTEILCDVVTLPFETDFIPSLEIPRFIRDIKKEAREAGKKGTKKLQRYLNVKQTATILINTINSSTNDMLKELYS